MCDFRGGNGLGSAFYTIQKIAVMAHHVPVSLLDNLSRTQDRLGPGIHFAVIIDADPAFVAFKFISSRSPPRFRLVVVNHLDAVGIGGGELVAYGGVEQAVLGKLAPAFVCHGAGILTIVGPLRQVIEVSAQIGKLASRVVKYPAKTTMTSLRRVGFIRSGSEPHIVVKALGHGHCRLGRTGRAVMIVGMESMHLADHAAPSGIDREPETADTPALGAALIDRAVSFHNFRDRPAFGNRKRNGFFAVYILARLGRSDGNQGVPMVGCCDQHRKSLLPYFLSTSFLALLR